MDLPKMKASAETPKKTRQKNPRREGSQAPRSARRRQRQFETLESRHLMTAVGWETPLTVPPLEQHLALNVPPLEMHGLLEPQCGHGVHGFINLRDYEGNLLSNWQDLIAVHEEEHDHEELLVDYAGSSQFDILHSSSELDGGDIPIEEQYSLWNNKWPQGALGAPITVTYSYSNILDGTLSGVTADQIKAGVEKALQLWSAYAPLNFVEVVDSGPAVGDSGYTAGTTPNLRIGYHAMDGASQVLAHAYYPQGTQGLSGDLHFDNGESWRIGAGGGGIDFVEVALHEFGHALGLQHENTASAIMNPYYGGRFATINSAYLLADDIAGIRAMYGTGTGSVTPIVVNHTPVLNSINDVTMSRSQNTVDVTLTASDSDNDTITFTATASPNSATAQLAYQLDQQHGFTLSGGSDYYNYRGANEKYVVGSNGQWYFILSDGSLYSWVSTIQNSTQVATLDSSYHTTLSKLYNAQIDNSQINVGLALNGNTLTIDPANGYTGTFSVTVNASDGELSASRLFNVTVANQTPTLAAIADQSMKPSDDSKAITLTYADADADLLTVTATVDAPDAIKATAYALDQQRQFQAAPNEYHNLRGVGEKYLQDSSGNWYYILSDGKVYSWGGSIAASTLIETLDSRYHADVSLLYNAQPDSGAPANVVLTVVGNTLTVNPPNGYTGEFEVTVTVSDGAASAQRKFMLDVANHAPTVNAIADQTMSPSTASKVVVVTATDSDGDSVTLSATAVQVDVIAQQAYDLDQQYGFQAAASDYHNLRGAGEKYFLDSANNWYFILGNGEVYSWGGSIAGSTLIDTLSSTYHTTLSSLYNAQAPVVQAINAGLSWNGNSLTISPPNGFTGSFQVTVTANDGITTSSQSFAMTVVNNAPQLASIANQTMSPNANSLQVALNATDADADNLTYTMSAVQVNAVAQTAYSLDQQYNFQAAPNEYLNYRGANEKYFQNASGNWYFILPNASVYAWTTSIASSTLLGQVDASYYTTVSKFFNVAAPTGTPVNADLQVSNGVLTIDPPANFTGSFQVTVQVSDGLASAQRSFQVTVENQAPTLAAITNQSMPTSQDSIQVALNINDADGDALTITTSATQTDAMAQLAYNLDQQHGFYASVSEYQNLRGAGEKYFQGTGGNWFFILANGELYSWGGSIAGSSLVATLNGTYYANLNLVHQAQQPTPTNPNVVLSVANGVLTVNPANGFTGQFNVTVNVSDGVRSAARTFSVTVTSGGAFSAPMSAANTSSSSFVDTAVIVLPSSPSAGDIERLNQLTHVTTVDSTTGDRQSHAGDSLSVASTAASQNAAMPKEVIDRAFSYFARHKSRAVDNETLPEEQGGMVELPANDEDAAIDALFAMLGA